MPWFKEFLKWAVTFQVSTLLLFPSILVTQAGRESPGEASGLKAQARIRRKRQFDVFFIVYLMHKG